MRSEFLQLYSSIQPASPVLQCTIVSLILVKRGRKQMMVMPAKSQALITPCTARCTQRLEDDHLQIKYLSITRPKKRMSLGIKIRNFMCNLSKLSAKGAPLTSFNNCNFPEQGMQLCFGKYAWVQDYTFLCTYITSQQSTQGSFFPQAICLDSTQAPSCQVLMI